MKFAAAAITPGRAKTCQKGTEPSAKSIQSVPFPGTPQVSAAAARCGAATKQAQAASRMTNSLFTRPCLKLAARETRGLPRCGYVLLADERAVDLGDFLGLGRLVRLRLVVLRRRATAVEPEAREVDAVATVGVALLARGQQGLALVGLLRHLLGRPDIDRAVPLQPGGGRDQLPDDHVLLQAQQAVDLA